MGSVMMTAAATRCRAGGCVDIARQTLFFSSICFRYSAAQVTGRLTLWSRSQGEYRAAVMAIGKHQAYCIATDRLDALDFHIAFTGLQRFLPRPVATRFGGWCENLQVFEIQRVVFAAFITKFKLDGISGAA